MNDYRLAEDTLMRGLEIALKSEDLYRQSDFYNSLALLFLLQAKLEEAEPYIVNAIEVDSKVQKSVWVSMLTYANFLYYDKKIEDCLPIVAVLHQHIDSYGAGEAIVNQYFLQPLIYRVQQLVGDDAWQKALELASETSIDEAFETIVQQVNGD